VTVIAGTAAEAEVLAKALYLLGADAGGALLARHGATGVIVDDAGDPHPLPGFADYLR
jgi:thiamine biosynthesis lipoprotein ApbE